MLRRAAVLKRICDRRRAQNALCVINYYCPLGLPPLIIKNGWRTYFYYIIGGFPHNAKATSTTRIAGGFFVF